MSGFVPYTHVERITSSECEGLLEYPEIWLSYKLDGTNGSVWWDAENGCVACGSRNRELREGKDNAGFWQWVNGDSEDAVILRQFVKDNPTLHVYGEWGVGRVGRIKDYDEEAKGHFWVFDVFENGSIAQAIRYPVWHSMLVKAGYQYYIPHYGFIGGNFTMGLLRDFSETPFLLKNADHPGEGCVIKAYDWFNKWGRVTYGKLVREEYVQEKKQSTKVKRTSVPVEEAIVKKFVTEAELAKTRAKVLLATGHEDLEKSDIARYLQTVFHDAVLECWCDVYKMVKRAKIDMGELERLTYDKARKYIGLA